MATVSHQERRAVFPGHAAECSAKLSEVERRKGKGKRKGGKGRKKKKKKTAGE